MVVEHAVTIERPLSEVWAVFDDPVLLVEAQGMILAYEQVSGDPAAAGSVSRQTIENSDGGVDLTVTLLDRRPPEFSKSQYEGLLLPFTISSTFTAIDDRLTEWHAVIDLRLNILQTALGPLLKGTLADQAERNAEDFKRYVESR
jgi:hypothetical protein